MKSNDYLLPLNSDLLSALFSKIKHPLFLIFCITLQTTAWSTGITQEKINLNVIQRPISEVIEEIKKQTSYKFFYITDDIDLNQNTTIEVTQQSITNVLKILFAPTNINFKIAGQQIILKKKSALQKSFIIEKDIMGKVKDSYGNTLPGASVILKGTTIGTETDFDGNFSLTIPDDSAEILVISYIGFETQEISIKGKESITITLLESDSQLESVVLVGSRNPSRTATDTPVAVDVINLEQITSQGPQTSVNEILNYAAPSFTSQTQTVSDGTDHIDPASLRGLGPDQVLVLINGKRRHNTALINTNGTVGAGSVGTDMNAIPTAAIDRIEVLRDGAAAQYGSDAIAGIINIVLKKDTNKLNLMLTTGANFSENSNQFEGGSDGEKVKIEANYGLPIGEDGGYINFTGSLATREPALRNKDYSGDIFRGLHGAERIFAANGGNVADMTLEDYRTSALDLEYIDQSVLDQIQNADLSTEQGISDFRTLLNFDADTGELDARGLDRSNFRFKVGTSKLREGKFFANTSIPVSDNAEVYAFGGLSYRKGLASGFYRRPAQSDGRANTPAFPNGFLPNIGTDIVDKSFAVGIKGTTTEGWDIDFSNTYGGNTIDFTVGNSSNGTLGVGTPRTFEAGAIGFFQNTTNLEINKFYDEILEGLNVAFGAEYKIDHFEITAGEEASYTSYDINGDAVLASTPDNLLVRNNFTGSPLAGSAQVFRGYDPNNAIEAYRNSIAAYVDIEADITEKWLVSLAGRYENYSDFGDTFNYKLATRLKILEELSLRGAISTGFRAPSLHQQFFSRTSTVFNNGIPSEQGIFTNNSRVANLIGIEKLREENSRSYSVGITSKFGNFRITADAYFINIDDRIVFSGSFGPGPLPAPGEAKSELRKNFEAAGATSARFFVNSIDTKSKGFDIVISHKTTLGENTKFQNDLSATFSETEVDAIRFPSAIAEQGSFFDGQEEAFLTLAQPRVKSSLSNMITFDKYSISLRNTFFGEVTDPDDYSGVSRVSDRDPNDDAVYSGKLVTDLSFSAGLTDNLKVIIGANNLFDVYPDENRANGTAGDQFVYSRRTSQFGYTGRFLFARLNLNL